MIGKILKALMKGSKGGGGKKSGKSKGVSVSMGGGKSKHTETHFESGRRAPAEWGANVTANGTVALVANMKTHFDNIFATEFSEYQVQEQLPVERVNPAFAGKGGWPYPYALFSGSRLVALIMITPQGKYHTKGFFSAQQAAQGAGVTFINFNAHYPHEYAYVVDRIKSFIGK